MADQERLVPLEPDVEYESDYTEEEELPKPKPCKTKKQSRKKNSKLKDRDDLSGMMLNMVGKIDAREIFIIWIVFIFIHTPAFADHILKKFKGTTNEDSTMTMRGTLYSSIFMILVVIVCSIVF